MVRSVSHLFVALSIAVLCRASPLQSERGSEEATNCCNQLANCLDLQVTKQVECEAMDDKMQGTACPEVEQTWRDMNQKQRQIQTIHKSCVITRAPKAYFTCTLAKSICLNTMAQVKTSLAAVPKTSGDVYKCWQDLSKVQNNCARLQPCCSESSRCVDEPQESQLQKDLGNLYTRWRQANAACQDRANQPATTQVVPTTQETPQPGMEQAATTQQGVEGQPMLQKQRQ